MKFKSPVVKNILSALAVAFFGLILLNLTFLFDALFQVVIRRFVRIFMPLNPNAGLLPPLFHCSFVVVIGIISWCVFRSKLQVIYKATYMTVPVAVVLATVGIFLYPWRIISYSVGGLLCIGTLCVFYRTKQPWLYYYTVILVSLALTIFSLSGGEI